MNTLIRLIEEFPNKRWDCYELSRNPNLSLDYILSHPKISRDILWLGRNPNLTINYILKHPEINWWNWASVSSNSRITLEDIDNYPELPWDWQFVAMNSNITMEFILKHIDKFNSKNVCMFLGCSSNITIQDIENYPVLFWNKSSLSCNPNVTLDYMVDHPTDDHNNDWDCYSIAEHTSVSVQDIYMKYPEFFTDGKFTSALARNPNVTIDIIKNYPEFKLKKNTMWQNPSITLEDIESFDENDIDYEFVSLNPNLTYEWIVKNAEKLDWTELSCNKFAYHPYFDNPIIIRI